MSVFSNINNDYKTYTILKITNVDMDEETFNQ